MTAPLRPFLFALQRHMRIPVSALLARRIGNDAAMPAHSARSAYSARYAPLAGIAVGVLQAIVYIFASILLPHAVALLLAIGVGLFATGARHERGWAGFCEGPGAAGGAAGAAGTGASNAIGAAGAIGATLLLLLRYETLVHIDADWIAAALVCAAALSRGCAVLVMTSLPPASPGSDDAEQRDAPNGAAESQVPAAEALVALTVAVLPLLLLSIWIRDVAPAVLGLALALIATATVRRTIRRRRQGCTGDCVGAVQQLAEAAFLLGLLIALGVAYVEPLADPAS
jgi:adenosylcobinamide-GDP ribazoletransferase